MFSNAKTLKSNKASAKKSDKAEIEIAGLADFAAIKFMMKTLEAVASTIETQVKNQMSAVFVKEGCATKKKPESFKGFDGEQATASCEFRKRSTASGLSDEEVAILDIHGIEYDTDVKVEETFVINPEYVADQAMLAKVEKALKGIKGLPADFIMKQEGVSKRVVTDNTVAQVFNKDPKTAAKLLPLVSVLAIKPTMATDDVNEVFPLVKPLLGLISQNEVNEFHKAKDSKRKSFSRG